MSTNLFIPNATFTFRIEPTQVGQRLDFFLAGKFSSYSRTFLQKMIIDGAVCVNGAICTKQGLKLKQDDVLIVTIPDASTRQHEPVKQVDFNIEILHTHEHFLIINKPAGLATHASSTAPEEPTLVDWITQHFHEIKNVGAIDRPGIVHRLDKDTSGVMVIARTNHAHCVFGDIFKNKHIQKTYLALVEGHPAIKGTIDIPIGRHPVLRHKMHAFKPNERHQSATLRESCTHYSVLTYFEDTALIQAKPVTGRTHQIRVHMAAIGHPLLGDQTYGKKSKLIKRHALHAHKIEFTFDEQQFEFSCHPPADFQHLIKQLTHQ